MDYFIFIYKFTMPGSDSTYLFVYFVSMKILALRYINKE